MHWLGASCQLPGQQRARQGCKRCEARCGHTKGVLIPLHGLLQALHGPGHPVDVLRLRVDAQRDVAPRHSLEHILAARQVARHQGEQVAGLGKGVLPDSKVPATSLRYGLQSYVMCGWLSARKGQLSTWVPCRTAQMQAPHAKSRCHCGRSDVTTPCLLAAEGSPPVCC